MTHRSEVAVVGFCAGALPMAMAASILRSREVGQRCAAYNRAVALHQRADALLRESQVALAKKKAADFRAAALNRQMGSVVRSVVG